MTKRKKEKRQPRHRRSLFSSIQQHKRIGKALVPPLNAMERMARSSWRDDHAPELLWAFLIATTMPRDQYFGLFRLVSKWARKTFPKKDSKDEKARASPPVPESGILNVWCEVDHTSIAEYTDEQFKEFISILTKHPLGFAALRPLLLLDALPAIGRWRSVLEIETTDKDWFALADAIAQSFDHQSEKSTDIRWMKLVIKMISGKLIFPSGMDQTLEEILAFPDKGDMRKVRPFIRAGEMSFRRNPPAKWIDEFWAQLMEQTGCLDGSTENDYSKVGPVLLSLRTILEMRAAISTRFDTLKTPTRTDARLDGTFGLVLYALSLLEEIAMPPISHLILGRLGLRSLAEVVITYSYLTAKDTRAIWEAYRSYGAGIAKLAFLKLEQAMGDAPSFVDLETLEQVANEDVWQEFVDVNLGHWANRNLRDLATESNTKDIYDAYYDWTSTYTHGHWGAVRDSNFVTCHNPLHRLHRIPRPMHRLLPSVVPDAINLVNRTLDLLEQAHPEMEELPRIALTNAPIENAIQSDAEKPEDVPKGLNA